MRGLPGVAAVLAVIALVAVLRACGGDEPAPRVPTVPAPAAAPQTEPFADPFAWAPERRDELARRAAAGHAHGLYAFAPGGIEASAARTARWRRLVEGAARQAGVSADRLEAMVLLESAGREDALTGFGVEGAAGLTQIVAETATNLLGMRVDVPASKRIGRQIRRAFARGDLLRVERLRRKRRAIDERFDPPKALAATARYLIMARERFGREDLAFVSYHMGIGNLESVLAAFGEHEHGWVEVYFATTPLSRPGAHARLSGFADDSANYFWKVEAAREMMALHRSNPGELRRRAVLHTAKSSAEELLHPEDTTARYADPKALRSAWAARVIRPFPDRPAITGLRRDRRMGELARRVGAPPGLYHGLRPEALALALYMGAQVRAIAGEDTSLIVTSTVRDQAYQRQLVARNREATRNYSLHTTGWAFDVERRYRDRDHALAFQFVLDRLRALNLIAWAREPRAIHITVSSDAKVLLPLLERLKR